MYNHSWLRRGWVVNILSSNSIAHKEPLCPMCFFPISLLYTGIGLRLVGRRLWLGLDYLGANL